MTKINIKLPPKPNKHTRHHYRPKKRGLGSQYTDSPSVGVKLARTRTTGYVKKAHSKVRWRVKQAIAPTKANQYRPRLVGRYGLVILIALIFGAQLLYSEFTGSKVLGVTRDLDVQGLLDATNKARAEQGESPLVLNTKLEEAANLKGNDMYQHQYWDHTSPSGVTPWFWFREVGYEYSHAGENLAKNFSTSENVLSAWLASPSHRDNVLNKSYKEVGFAVMDGELNGDETTLIIALYGDPVEATPFVYGATNLPKVNNQRVSNIGTSMSLMTRVGLELQSMSPVMVSSMLLLFIATIVALLAHMYRKKMPVALKRSWYRHHGLYKAIGLVTVAVVLVVVYGDVGQI